MIVNAVADRSARLELLTADNDTYLLRRPDCKKELLTLTSLLSFALWRVRANLPQHRDKTELATRIRAEFDNCLAQMRKAEGKARDKAAEKATFTTLWNALPGDATKCFTDGSSYGNPGQAGLGYSFQMGQRHFEGTRYLGVATNNVAELEAIKDACCRLEQEIRTGSIPRQQVFLFVIN